MVSETGRVGMAGVRGVGLRHDSTARVQREGFATGSAILGGTEYTALGDTVNAAFRLEAATKSIGLGVALGDRTFAELGLATEAPFARREVALKGYEALKTAWGISFEELQAFLASRP